jgi:hypothetical protein
VLLLGSYPSEVQANLEREKLNPRQPTTVDGHAFYSGRLAGRRIVLAIAGPSPAVTNATKSLALTLAGLFNRGAGFEPATFGL